MIESFPALPHFPHPTAIIPYRTELGRFNVLLHQYQVPDLNTFLDLAERGAVRSTDLEQMETTVEQLLRFQEMHKQRFDWNRMEVLNCAPIDPDTVTARGYRSTDWTLFPLADGSFGVLSEVDSKKAGASDQDRRVTGYWRIDGRSGNVLNRRTLKMPSFYGRVLPTSDGFIATNFDGSIVKYDVTGRKIQSAPGASANNEFLEMHPSGMLVTLQQTQQEKYGPYRRVLHFYDPATLQLVHKVENNLLNYGPYIGTAGTILPNGNMLYLSERSRLDGTDKNRHLSIIDYKTGKTVEEVFPFGRFNDGPSYIGDIAPHYSDPRLLYIRSDHDILQYHLDRQRFEVIVDTSEQFKGAVDFRDYLKPQQMLLLPTGEILTLFASNNSEKHILGASAGDTAAFTLDLSTVQPHTRVDYFDRHTLAVSTQATIAQINRKGDLLILGNSQ